MYNKKQQIAIDSEEKQIVIVAPPGSGKTTTMSGAIEHYLEKHNPEHVIAVTFTKVAAADLKEKVFNNNVVHTATIHSWSFKELRKLADKYNFRAKILQEDQIIQMLQPMMRAYEVSKYAKWKVYHFVMGNYNIDVPDYMKQKYKAIALQYNKEKRKRHLYDFTDLPLYLYDKLKEHDEYIKTEGLFVDEFQDVDPIQLKVFNRVFSEKKFFIGDPDQAIYIFRGASSKIFQELIDFKTYNLDINYRSYQTIIDYATSFKKSALFKIDNGIPCMPGDVENVFKSHIKSFKGKGGTVIAQSSTYDIEEVYKDNIDQRRSKMIIREGIQDKEPRILCRTNKEVKKLKEFGYDNVSTVHQAKGLEFQNVILVNYPIVEAEDVNISYVALTRAENRLLIFNFDEVYETMKMMKRYFEKQNTIESAF